MLLPHRLEPNGDFTKASNSRLRPGPHLRVRYVLPGFGGQLEYSTVFLKDNFGGKNPAASKRTRKKKQTNTDLAPGNLSTNIDADACCAVGGWPLPSLVFLIRGTVSCKAMHRRQSTFTLTHGVVSRILERRCALQQPKTSK